MTAASPIERVCAWCRRAVASDVRRDAKFCSKRCRQAHHRFGSACVVRQRATAELRFAYADPPYPGLARRYYEGHPDYAGEVDHGELLSRLQGFDGWALSTSSSTGLRHVMWLCEERGLDVRCASWHRGHRPGKSYWPHDGWEPVVYWGGRREEPSADMPVNVLEYVSRPRTTDPARVVGAKPAAFCYWLFDLLGALPGDGFVDVFPGSGGVARAWELYSAGGPRRRTSSLDI